MHFFHLFTFRVQELSGILFIFAVICSLVCIIKSITEVVAFKRLKVIKVFWIDICAWCGILCAFLGLLVGGIELIYDLYRIANNLTDILSIITIVFITFGKYIYFIILAIFLIVISIVEKFLVQEKVPVTF